MWRISNRAGRSIQGAKEHWVPKRGVYRAEQQEGCANRLCLSSGSPKLYMKCISCAIHSWVSTAVLSIVRDSVEWSAVMKYSRYITLKYSKNKLLHFLALVILVSVSAEYDFARALVFVELWENIRKWTLLCCSIDSTPFSLLLDNNF